MKKQKRDIVEKVLDREEEDAEDRADLLDIKVDAAEAYKDAAVSAAKMLANANLITELTHSVGEGTDLTPTTVSWKSVSSI